MKKLILSLILLMGVCLVFQGIANASETRVIKYKTAAITASGVAVGHGETVRFITGRANSTNTSWGLYDTVTLGAETALNCKIEGGEASQYEAYGPYDFGTDGLVFDTGLTAVVTSAHLVVVYH